VRAVFADTFYFLALLNRRDSHHDRAVAESRKRGLQLVTTDLIIVELADALCKPEYRQEVIAIWRILETDNDSSVVEVSAALLRKGRLRGSHY
jgi:predicted nucleic acid-binding protein